MSGGGRRPPRPPDPTTAARGLCDACRHRKLVHTTRGSTFSMCLRARDDPAFPKYPRLPVLSCRGFEPGSPGGASADGDLDRA